MTREETVNLMRIISGCYPHFNPNAEKKKEMTASWYSLLCAYRYEDVEQALIVACMNSKDFVPTVMAVLEVIQERFSPDYDSFNDEWKLVTDALSCCNYSWDAKRSFDNLTPLGKRFVGSAERLQVLSRENSDRKYLERDFRALYNQNKKQEKLRNDMLIIEQNKRALLSSSNTPLLNQ